MNKRSCVTDTEQRVESTQLTPGKYAVDQLKMCSDIFQRIDLR